MQDRLELLRIFAAAASAPSFREAAARIGVSPQVVTRAVQGLEQELGETLFHRNTRHVQITTYGQDFAAHAQAALQTIEGLFGSPAGESGEARGTVRITAPAFLGRTYVMPVLAELNARHPGIHIDLRLSDTPSAVVDEQIDIGVRVGLIADNRFVARYLGRLPMWVVASPSLLERVGEPKNLKALESLPLTALIDRSNGRAWPWVFRADDCFIPRAPVFLTDNPEAEVEAATAGMGFTQCTEYMIRAHIESGKLVRVLRKLEPEPWTLHVYRPQRGPVSKRVRTVFDELVVRLKETICRE
jgi:DNA-binding transcriptional LysR family regulator